MKVLCKLHHFPNTGKYSRPVFLGILFLSFFSMNAFSQNMISVKGRVLDEKGDPVIGASVTVKGSTTGGSTNNQGDFEITAPPKSKLVITNVGYSIKEITVNGNSFLNVTMQHSETGLNEVVVIGYGSQRKEAITGSVSSISGGKLNQVPSSNISDALQGRLPGVQISQTSTQPGSTMQILIRGQRSISASNAPLIVLDGIPFSGSFSDIDPENVKSISVLKDASATAIYGSRGANGVILITTNKGFMGQKPQISYNSYYGIHKLWAPYPMMNGPQFDSLRVRANKYTNGSGEAEGVNTDWQKLFYRPSSPVTNQNIDVSGGTAKGSYHLGLGYYDDQSLVPTQDFKRFSINSSIDQGVGKYIRVGFTTNTDYNVSNGSQVGLYNILTMSPLASPYNADGSLKQSIQMPLDN